MSDVAVALLNWNGKRLLEKFLPNVIQNTSGTDIYVIDNGSTDGSVEFLRENFPEVKVIELDRNYGFAGGYNRGLKLIKAKYYVLLNTDVEVTSGWLEPLVRFAEKDGKIAAVQPKILWYKDRRYFEYAGASGGFIDKLGYPFARGRIFSTLEQDHGQYDDIIEIFWASGAAMLIRSEAFWSVGGFDQDFFAHMEEIDLAWRLKNRGYKLYVYPKVVVYHIGGGTLEYKNPYKTFLNFRNNLYMLIKNLPKKNKQRVLFLRLILDFIASFNFLLHGEIGNFMAVYRAYFYVLCHKRELKQKRRALERYNRFDYEQVLGKSIVWLYYVKGKKYFSELNINSNCNGKKISNYSNV